MKTILIIEDDEHIVELLKFNIENKGYNVVASLDGKEGYLKAKNELPDLILLDLMLPGMDGIEICKRLKNKKSTSDIPIIMLTAKGDEDDRILGLETGADDYIVKPFSIKELLVRIKIILKRYSISDENIIIGNLVIDNSKHEVKNKDELVKLTLKEYQLLEYLAINKGKVLSRNSLLDRVWGDDYFGDTRTLDVHIRHLRKKIKCESGEIIETVRGVGYKMK